MGIGESARTNTGDQRKCLQLEWDNKEIGVKTIMGAPGENVSRARGPVWGCLSIKDYIVKFSDPGYPGRWIILRPMI